LAGWAAHKNSRVRPVELGLGVIYAYNERIGETGAVIKILHVITDLDRGGAEYCLKRLIGSTDTQRFSSKVVSLLPLGPLGNELRAEGIDVASLNCRTLLDVPRALWHLSKIIRWTQPDVIQTWLYHADFFGTLTSFSRRNVQLVWNVRNSDLSEEKRFSRRALTWLLALMSGRADGIISNSIAGIDSHTRLGYKARQWAHIPNGWQIADQVPTPELRRAQREKFGLPTDDILIGLVARPAKQKDFECFFSAVSLLHNRMPNLKFVLIGRDVTPAMNECRCFLNNSDILNHLIFLGEQANVQSVLPALDAMTLTSAFGEGLPNSIGEAMAAGLPVICTDVGDVKRLVTDRNWIVPPKTPEALTNAWVTLAQLEPTIRATIGESNRNWIKSHYSIEQMQTKYDDLYAMLVQARLAGASSIALEDKAKAPARAIIQ
jgi:glycosyltransferase involved in cell wall biosynthesis